MSQLTPARESTFDKVYTVAAAITLYNSDDSVVANIGTYIKQVDKLYIIDNSEISNDVLIQKLVSNFSNTEYIHNIENKGVAYALNVGAQAAVRDGYNYLLMMDDDSSVNENMVDTMLAYIDQSKEKSGIGVVAAQPDPNFFSDEAASVYYAITSGSLLSIDAYKKCGPFQDELFIDAVDHEYCFRLIKYGYRIISLNYLHLHHSIGELKRLVFLGKTVYKWASHNPIRNYYMLRNFLYILKKYKASLPTHVKAQIVYDLTKVCLLNSLLEKDTFVRLRFMNKAVIDFKSHKFGKIK